MKGFNFLKSEFISIKQVHGCQSPLDRQLELRYCPLPILRGRLSLFYLWFKHNGGICVF